MARTLEERVARLEAQRAKKTRWPILLWGTPTEATQTSEPEQRVVEDWYRDFGGLVYTRKRIATDPNDEGRRCDIGGCLIDVVRELHEKCPWREIGSCNVCAGLDLQAEPVEIGDVPRATSSAPLVTLKPCQWRIFSCDARFRILVAGRRFGKTFLALAELCHAARKPGSLVWYVAPTYKQAKRIAWKALKDLTRPFWASAPNETELRIELTTGGTICLRGADNPDSLRGDGLDFLVMDEYASMPAEAWTEVLRPALTDKQGRALFIGTPQGYNHLYELYTGVQGRSDWVTFQFSTEEGGNVSLEELASAAQQLDKRVYQQEFCASFESLTSGRAYYAFERAQDVDPVDYDPRYPLVWALDFNVDPGCSLLAQVIPCPYKDQAWRLTLPIPPDHVNVLDEIALRDSNTYEVCKEFARRTEDWIKHLPFGRPKLRVEVYGDAAGENRNASAPRTSWQIVRDFFADHHVDYDVIYSYASKNPPVRDRINCVNAMFCNARDQRSITVSPKCEQLIRDLEQVSWKHDANGNDTGDLDKSNPMRTHTSDALGYFVAEKFPMRPQSSWPTTRPLY